VAAARTRLTRALRSFTVALALIALGGAAHAVQPSDRWSAKPSSIGLQWEQVSFASTRDEASLTGWWFPGEKGQPVLVLCADGRGSMADQLGNAREFVSRGFSVLTFDYRDFGPAGPGPVDSLTQLAFASRWVNDTEGALRFARRRAEGRPVFVSGQGLGGALALAAVGRSRENADAVACEGLFRTLNELLRSSGLAQVPGVPERHRFLVETSDEPLAVVPNLTVPLHVAIALKDEVFPAAVTREVVSRSLSRIDRWMLPEAGHEDIAAAPGYHDRLAGWFRRIAGMLREEARMKAAQQGSGTP
jgi:dienelactone hydrolase